MQTLRVAAISMNSVFGQEAATLEAVAAHCRAAAARGADLVLLPELVLHGHNNPRTADLAEAVPAGPGTQRLVALARELRLFICCGLSEAADGHVYNTAVLVGPEGYVGRQRKLHLSADEALHYRGGSDVPVFDIGKARVGIVICYDNELPEVPRLAALHGAEVLLMPHASRSGVWADTPLDEARVRRRRLASFEMRYRMRAFENACFCVITDQAGRAGVVPSLAPTDGNQPHHAGAILFIEPDGDVLAHAQDERVRDEMLVCDLDPARLQAARARTNCTLRTRRAHLFSDLAASGLPA